MNFIRIRGIKAGLTKAKNQPKLRVGLTLFDLGAEIAGLITILVMWILVFAFYFKLPDIIPVHYDSAGVADSFGQKNFILLFAAIATIAFVMMTVLNRFPHRFSYLVKITENNALTQYLLACRMIRCLKLAIVVIFIFIIIQTIRIAEGKTDSLSSWFLYLLIGLTALTVIYFMIKSFIYR
jgi:uncharacterized membrane protein